MEDLGGDKPKTKKAFTIGRLMIYILLGVGGTLACCCTGGIGLWVIHIMNKPDPMPGEWSGMDQVDLRREAGPWKDPTMMKLTLQVENGECTGTYFSRNANGKAPPGKSFPIRWKVDGRTLEMEIIGEGTFWTAEKKARFTYTIIEELAGYKMTLVPTIPNKSSATFSKSKPRPFPT